MRCGIDFGSGEPRRLHIDWWQPFEPFVIGRHDRRQMPVGQGGFHVGALSAIPSDTMSVLYERGVERFRDADFLYVYDCGSEPKKSVLREVGRLARHRTRRKLDMLFLSHFDRDHICGTPALLAARKGFQVDTIMLPFVDDAERMIAFARAAAESAAGNGAIGRFFRDMVVDPVATLQRFGPRQIIQVVSGDGAPPIDGSPGDPPSGDPEGPISWKLVAEGKDGRRTAAVTRPPNDGGAAGPANFFVVHDPAVIAADRGGAFEWLLKPWVKPADPVAVALFCSEAERELGWIAGTFRARMANQQDRRHVVTRGRTKLARAYRTAFADKNLTSMCLYSGLLDPDGVAALTLDPIVAYHPRTKIGWMGTGDANLKEVVAIDEFERFYGAEIEYVSSFAFPHHGSIENSNPDRLVSNADHWIASAEPVHDWLHPHPYLQAAAISRGKLRHVRSVERSAFDEAMIFAKTEAIGLRGCHIWIG